MKKINSPEDLKSRQEEAKKTQQAKEKYISIPGGTCGLGAGAKPVIEKTKEVIAEKGLEDTVELKITGCQGFCEQYPLMVIRPQGIFYVKVEPEDVPEIIEETIINDRLVERLLYTDPETSKKVTTDEEVPFYKHQKRLVFKNNRFIEPTSIDDYFSVDGYTALARTLYEMSPEDVIEETIDAGLRGRGGAGFPAGKKWKYCRMEEAEPKYLACNADEGDPGAYMDRSILEGNPHLVIEGMIIAAYAIGSHQGYIYVRAEYPLAVKHTRQALEAAREHGLLGENIMGSDFDFDLEVAVGAGAFVAGESTALMHSIEGKRPMPRQTPPRSVQQGLFGKPTVLNNVETFGNVPLIIMNGADWFKEIGTENSKGTKIFSLVGKVKNTGLIEVPMGITLREIVFDIGGGIPNNKKVKAIQTGGPSGGCIPEDLFDLKVDFDELSKAGSMMGSGGMVVMDEDTCMVDVAKFFLDFLKDESCGKCLPCRNGIPRMLEILTRITEGQGTEADLIKLEEISNTIKKTALCGLGDSAPNPVLSTIEYFRDEYEAHIHDLSCPAGVCPSLIYYKVNEEECKACDRCRKACPVDAITGEPGGDAYVIDNKICISCGTCIEECPFDAINVIPGQQKDSEKVKKVAQK